MKKRWMSFFALLLAVVLVCGAVPAAANNGNAIEDEKKEYQEQIADLNAQLSALQKEQEKLQANINAAKDDKAKQQAQKNQLDNEIYTIKQEISLLDDRITLLGEQVAEKEQEIEAKQAEIDENYELFKRRLRASYMSNDPTLMTILFSSDSFSELLMKAEVARSIAERDNLVVETLRANKAELEEMKAGLEADKAAIEADKAQKNSQKQTLDSKVSAIQKTIQDISALEAQFKADYAAKSAEMAEMRAEIDSIFEQLESIGDYVGGEYMWPVPKKYSTISSEFGWRFGGTDYHTGFDITGASIYGASIYAANSGTVAFVQRTYTPGKGYGKYVIVDHGGGYSTLYAHCSDVLVSVGDVVLRGDTIAKVGSTGWSTGPHLHFEYRVNGVAKNPRTIFF